MKYFQNCTTPANVKALYRDLAMQHHPDRGGNTRTMQDINAEYLQALQRLDGHIRRDGVKEYTYRYNASREEELIVIMARLIRSRLPEYVTVEIVGVYIWVSGTRRDDMETRAKLTADDLKLRWHSKRERWYWKPADCRSRYNQRLSYDEIKNYYGSCVVEKEAQPHRQSTPLPA